MNLNRQDVNYGQYVAQVMRMCQRESFQRRAERQSSLYLPVVPSIIVLYDHRELRGLEGCMRVFLLMRLNSNYS